MRARRCLCLLLQDHDFSPEQVEQTFYHSTRIVDRSSHSTLYSLELSHSPNRVTALSSSLFVSLRPR